MSCSINHLLSLPVREAFGGEEPAAINIFFRQSLREGGLPFDVRLERPNGKTRKAMEEAMKISRDPDSKGYTDVDEAFEDLER